MNTTPPTDADLMNRLRVQAIRERDELQSELDEISALLPDESPHKHEETGCSLHDDIQAELLASAGRKNFYNEVFGILFAAGYHGGTVQDAIRRLVADAAELKAIRDYLWPNQTGLPNEYRDALLAIKARARLAQEQLNTHLHNLAAARISDVPRVQGQGSEQSGAPTLEKVETLPASLFIPDGHYLVEDQDGERWVKKTTKEAP